MISQSLKLFSKTNFFAIFFYFLASNANAGIFSPFFDFYLSTEVSKSEVSNGGANSKFRNQNDLGQNFKDAEDIALGVHLRFFDRVGINANWTQSSMINTSLAGVSALSGKATLKTDQFNLTGLVFVPILSRHVELFGEAGIVEYGSSLSYSKNDGSFTKDKNRQTNGLYGGGLQISLLGSDFIRFSVHKYVNEIGLIDANYTTFRLGYLKSF